MAASIVIPRAIRHRLTAAHIAAAVLSVAAVAATIGAPVGGQTTPAGGPQLPAQPPPPGAQELPPILAALPPLIGVMLASVVPIYQSFKFEAPYEFRFNAALTAAEYDCLPVYAERHGYVPARGGSPPGRATPADRSEEAVLLCNAGVKVAITAHFFGEAGVAPMYAAAAGMNVSLPRGCPPGEACDDGCTVPPMMTEAACFGYHAVAKVTLDAIADDGFNADGRLGGAPYSDALTGYSPVNTPDALTSLLRWVPLVENLWGFGTFVTQRFTLPQAGRVQPALVSAEALDALKAPPPYKYPDAYTPAFQCRTNDSRADCGDEHDPDHICEQATGVLDAVAAANETDLVLSHFFDRKSTSLALFALQLPALPGFTYADYLVAEAVLNAANHDATRVVWREKARHDAVRPASLVRAILGATDARATTFTSALRTMPHPEYPSGSACVCRAFAETYRAFGGDALPLTWRWEPHTYGPGVPSAPLSISWPSLDALAAACSRSRLTAGLHFEAAVVEGERLCAPVAAAALKAFACRAPGTPGLPPCEA